MPRFMGRVVLCEEDAYTHLLELAKLSLFACNDFQIGMPIRTYKIFTVCMGCLFSQHIPTRHVSISLAQPNFSRLDATEDIPVLHCCKAC